MERLTRIRLDGLKTGYWSPSNKQDLIDRLAAYEDSGLMPEDVKRMVEAAKRKKDEKTWEDTADSAVTTTWKRDIVSRDANG